MILNKKGFQLVAKRFMTTSSLFVTNKAGGEVGKQPRAIALVLGFGGAKPRHLVKYSRLYNLKGCTTVSGTASNYDIFIGPSSGLDEFAQSAIQEVTKLLRDAKKNDYPQETKEIPIVMHIISNGGAFISRRICRIIDSNEQKELGQDRSSDLSLFARRLKVGYQIFDSAPCHLNLKSAFNVIHHLIPNSFIGVPAAVLFTMNALFITYAISIVTRKPPEPELFWNDLLDDTNCTRQAFIYTPLDDIADAEKIKEFIKGRKARGISVMEKYFEDSKHVQHLKLHGTEYSDFLDNVLDDMEEKNSHSNRAIDQNKQG
jgi:hypothetical protein